MDLNKPYESIHFRALERWQIILSLTISICQSMWVFRSLWESMKDLSESKAFVLLFKSFRYFVKNRIDMIKMIEHQIWGSGARGLLLFLQLSCGSVHSPVEKLASVFPLFVDPLSTVLFTQAWKMWQLLLLFSYLYYEVGCFSWGFLGF